LVRDRAARARGVEEQRRPEGVDARADLRGGGARIRRGLEGPRSARRRAGDARRALDLAEYVPQGDPGFPPRRGVVFLRGAPRGHARLAPRAVERALLARRRL